MVSVAHGGNDFAFNILIASSALRSIRLLIISGTIKIAILGKEATSGKRFVAFDTLKAALMEIFIGDP
jgi:hypothetical protein